MNETHILNELRASGYRMTQVRRLLVRILLREEHPVSPSEVLTELTRLDHPVNKTTVYRELSTLLEAGVIRAIKLHDRSVRYELAHRKHHHHIVCESCERVEDVVVDPRVCQEQERLKKLTGFKNIRHALEFFGVCANCQHI